jgi:hypothetical protein
MIVRATRAASLGTGAQRFIDDRLDGAGATPAFGAATKAAIDLLGVTQSVVGISDSGTDIAIAEDVAGTHDHGKRRGPSVMRQHRYLRARPDAKGKSGV